jgi:large subunit ribosomal protein L7/L12
VKEETMITKEDALKALDNMSVLEIIALTRKLEEEWGVKAVPAPVVVKEKPPEVQAQTEFTVKLVSVPSDKKMAVIKLVRDVIVGLGLKEAKELVESAPKNLKEGVDAAEAESLRVKLTEAGAVVEIK